MRSLPSVTAWPGLLRPLAETEPNDTLDQAQDLGNLTLSARGEAVGTIGNGPAGAADVDWYRFTLDGPARVTLATLDGTSGSAPCQRGPIMSRSVAPAMPSFTRSSPAAASRAAPAITAC
jgi:hypothetical protein